MSIDNINYKKFDESIEILITRITRAIKREQWVKICNLQNQLNVLYGLLDKLEQKEEENEAKSEKDKVKCDENGKVKSNIEVKVDQITK